MSISIEIAYVWTLITSSGVWTLFITVLLLHNIRLFVLFFSLNVYS